MGTQMAAGLAAIHDMHAMHRDIKPGNILLTPDMQCKIGDFGVSRTLWDVPDKSQIAGKQCESTYCDSNMGQEEARSMTGTAPYASSIYTAHVGTELYMSPEVAGSTGKYTYASDIYSLGCVLYEMLT